MRLIAAIVVLTLIAIGAGALAGLHLFAAAERAADAKKNRHAAASCHRATPAARGSGSCLRS